MIKIHLPVKARLPVFLVALFLLPCLFFWLLDVIFPLPAAIQAPGSTCVYYSDNTLARIFLTTHEQYRIAHPAQAIPAAVKSAFIICEDRQFYLHLGINPIAVMRAVINNIHHRRVVSGASTIPMQLIRMIEPRERTLFAKTIEAFRALQLTMHHSKDSILGMYLNRLPFGGNVQGVATASRLYFNKELKDLNIGEIAILVCIPRAPNSFHPVTGNRVLLKKARNRTLKLLYQHGLITRHACELARQTPLPTSIYPFPFELPHLSEYLFHQKGQIGHLHTCIDRSLQKSLEHMVYDYCQTLEKYRIYNACVLVLHNRTMALRAAIGSQDYNSPNEGQIIGFSVRRSPGSLLKPFLYAMAMEQGLITPDTLLEDIPLYFRDYEPKNYRGRFTGVSPARHALCESLNVPAIILLKQVGTAEFYRKTWALGLEPLHKAGYYGLSIILGALEVTPLSVLRAFSLFSNQGALRQVRILQDDSAGAGDPVFTPGASYLVSDMLSMHRNSRLDDHQERTAWKTGTSYRFRDAWCVGYDREYTVLVWVGNFNCQGVAEIVGARVAAPLLFRVMERVRKDRLSRWFSPPADTMEIEVCALSGMLPQPWCPLRKTTRVLKNKVPMDRCSYHKRLPVDSAGYLVCADPATQPAAYDVFTFFPPGVETWLSQENNLQLKPPRIRPECRQLPYPSPPIIRFPKSGLVFSLDQSQALHLEIANRSHSRFLYLFIDNVYFRRFSTGQNIRVNPGPGRHDIYVVNDFAEPSNTITITIQTPPY